MKKLFLLAIIMAVFGLTVFAQPKTVTDFYYAMSEDFFSMTAEGDLITDQKELTKHRKSLIKIEDAKNGYLRWKAPGRWAEIVLFKKTDEIISSRKPNQIAVGLRRVHKILDIQQRRLVGCDQTGLIRGNFSWQAVKSFNVGTC